MTWRKWTTSDQEEWLKTCLPEFADAQVNKTTSKEFLPTVLRDWKNSWPTPTPTPEEITQASNVEKAIQKKKANKDMVLQSSHCSHVEDELTLYQCIKAWFHNHMRGATSGNGACGLLKIGKQKRLQDWQVYHVMTYKTQWKTIIDKEWEKYRSTWKAKNSGKEPNETQFFFMTSFMRQKYQEETDKVQKDIEKWQEELRAALETKGDNKNHTYQKYAEFSHLSSNNNSLCCSAINCLPHTFAIWGESITKQTGWNITFLVGGPAPNQNRKIMSYL